MRPELKSISSIIRREQKRLWRTSPGLGLQSFWERTAGEDIAANTEVRSFRDGVMTVQCASGGWACELQLASSELAAELNALGPPEPVKEIRFVHQARGGGKSRK